MMRTKEIWYSVSEGDHSERFAMAVNWVCDATRKQDQNLLAENCAADFHAEHCGWQSAWPLEIAMYEHEDGPEIARLNVERDYDPIFTAQTRNDDAQSRSD